MNGRLAAGVGLALMAACARTPAAPDSGVEGIVLLGPQCPVVREGTPCPDEPFAVDIEVMRAGSTNVIATTRSGDDGRFRIALGPGDYVLDPVEIGDRPFPRGGPVEVTVRADEFAEVTITLDTGIR